jgi:nitroreductase
VAPVLGVVFARRHFAHNGKPNRWGAYDAGAAAMSLALQAHALGLAVHFMGGFDALRALEELGVPRGEYEAMAAFALGRPGDPGELSEELRERESPSGRKPLREVAFETVFKTE